MNRFTVVCGLAILLMVVGLFVVASRLSLASRTHASIEGIVVDPAGRPISGATIHVSVNEGDPREVVPPLPRGTSGMDGSYRIDSVNFQPFLVATHPDYCDSVAQRVQLSLHGARGVRLQLRVGGLVTGSLHPSLASEANRRIWLSGGAYWYNVSADESGRFALNHVVPGDYTFGLGETRVRATIIIREGQESKVVLGGQ